MIKRSLGLVSVFVLIGIVRGQVAFADENLFGYVRGAETLPVGSWELYEVVNSRFGKSTGTYRAFDMATEAEYGVSDRLTVLGAFKLQSVTTQGIVIDGYLPKDLSYGPRPSGLETAVKYNFLSPAKDLFGFATRFGLDYNWLDRHSGQDKNTISSELDFIFQKYFFEGELTWVGNVGTESTYAERGVIEGLPPGFEWPTTPEMEIGLSLGTGLSYRMMPNWYFGGEVQYDTEFETEIGQERWSIFSGPNLHYGGRLWWATLTWFPQIIGGGPGFPEQTKDNLHLIEKTEHEVRLKIGFNF